MTKIKRINKWEIEHILQGYYPSYGWEDLTCEETRKGIREQLKCYRENEPQICYRIIQRRVLSEVWQKLQAQA